MYIQYVYTQLHMMRIHYHHDLPSIRPFIIISIISIIIIIIIISHTLQITNHHLHHLS